MLNIWLRKWGSKLQGSGNKLTNPRSTKGKIVRYRIRARDNRDGKVGVVCNPRSGSFFRLGRTRVTCRAHDRAGNRAVRRFVVLVKHRKN